MVTLEFAGYGHSQSILFAQQVSNVTFLQSLQRLGEEWNIDAISQQYTALALLI